MVRDIPYIYSLMIKTFKFVALLEGLSFLLLVFICMPLKHIWEIPEPVRYVGMAHGVLFLAYCALLYPMVEQFKWKFKHVFLAFLAAILPFGTFVANKKIYKVME